MAIKKNRADAAKSAATRERLLAAAADVLSIKGYSETRLSDIAEIAEVRAPAVYYYFDSRETLIAEVMEVGQRRLREHVETALSALPEDTEPMERICVAVRAHLEVELQLSNFATAVTRNMGQLPEEVRIRLRTEGGEYMILWRQLLEQAHSAGQVRSDLDLRASRQLLIGALNWMPEWWDPHQGSLNRVIETAQSLIRHGLGQPQPQQHPLP